MNTQVRKDNISLAILAFISIGVSVMLFQCKKNSDTSSSSSSTGGGSPAANEVWMQNNAFSPASITVSVNTTVKWINKDNTAHTVTSTSSGGFDSGNIGVSGTYTHQFTAAGTYPYKCNFHSGMTGTVIVQ